jgi:predicted nucleic acid-binding protein
MTTTRSPGAIEPSWRVVEFNADIAEGAARLRAKLKFKLPDAVQAASALAINADALVTHDRDFQRLTALRVIS